MVGGLFEDVDTRGSKDRNFGVTKQTYNNYYT